MTIDQITSASNFSLEFFEEEKFVMDGFKCNSLEKFLNKLIEGFLYGSQYTIKVKIDNQFMDYLEFKKIMIK